MIMEVRLANDADLADLSTIFTESFHPVSPYMRQAIPDTPITRQWWKDCHAFAINDPQVRLFIALESSSKRIVGLIRYRIQPADAPESVDAGVWTRFSHSKDHDMTLCDPFMKFLGEQRQKWMGERPHFFIELLATVHEFKGRGVGRLLTELVCSEADEVGQEVFVETNGGVVKFYEQFGFQVKAAEVMPGGYGYEEYILIRPPHETS